MTYYRNETTIVLQSWNDNASSQPECSLAFPYFGIRFTSWQPFSYDSWCEKKERLKFPLLRRTDETPRRRTQGTREKPRKKAFTQLFAKGVGVRGGSNKSKSSKCGDEEFRTKFPAFGPTYEPLSNKPRTWTNKSNLAPRKDCLLLGVITPSRQRVHL